MKMCNNFLKNCLIFANYPMRTVTFITATVTEIMANVIYANSVNFFMTLEGKGICLPTETTKRNF